jgi:hypothetical protein
MNNIYEQKAKKYKYKYLKLKKEYLGEGGEYTEKKYVCQISENKWRDALEWEIKLIESKNKDKYGNHIVKKKNSDKFYIYIDSTQEIIDINDIEKRCKCLLFILPLYDLNFWINTNNNSTKLLTILKINEIINKDKDNDIDIKEIDNNINNNIDYHNLYFIHDVNKINSRWNICNEEWKKNILPNLLYYYNINYYNNNNKNKELLKYLQEIKLLINNNKYLLFKYDNNNYISYIIQENNERIQFTIINLVDGKCDIILYPLLPRIPTWFNVSTQKDYKNNFTDVKNYLINGNLGNNNGIEQILNKIQIVQQDIQKTNLLNMRVERQKEATNRNLKIKEELEKEYREKKQMDNCGFYYDISFDNKDNDNNKIKYDKLLKIFDPDNNIGDKCRIKEIANYHELKKFNYNKKLSETDCTKCAIVLTKNLNEEYTKYINNNNKQ